VDSPILLLLTPFDSNYVAHVKSCFGAATVFVNRGEMHQIKSWISVKNWCARHSISRIVTTSPWLLKKIYPDRALSINDFAGSLVNYQGIEVLFIDPLEQLITVPHGKFITSRYVSKFTSPNSWLEPTAFSWEYLTPMNLDSTIESFKSCIAIAIDIETKKDPLSIHEIGYTGIQVKNGKLITHTRVCKLKDPYDLAMCRTLNLLAPPKIFQNGKYDCAYLSRYNAVPYNYLWDTLNLFHSWYAELPKDLAYLNGFMLRTVEYWKDLASSQDPNVSAEYNARDTWATANVWWSMMREMPEWARHNYRLEFPLVFPCHLAEMTGIMQDQGIRKAALDEAENERIREEDSLERCTFKGFNASSPKQVKTLMQILGDPEPESSNEKALEKLANKSPLNRLIVDKLLNIRGLKKLSGTYLKVCDFHGRILFSINPPGTETGRNSSAEHHFWCGLQIQNIPRGKEVKQTLRADPGFYLAEADLEQAESRDTANISGSEPLIAAVSGSKDFHSLNASSFFGVTYDEIYDDEAGKTKNKALRDLAKRVNHGANYNMGPMMLVQTMGELNVFRAAKILGLPKYWRPKQIAEHLLASFHKTYPEIAGLYYPHVISQVRSTSKLTSTARHKTREAKGEKGFKDWTRYTFKKPWDSKMDLNSLVAHAPQSLNARTLNEAFMEVFYKVALPNPLDFKLCAQIHDSILFQYRIGREDLALKVKELMEIPVTLIDVSGKERTFTVPAALKNGKAGKPATYWSETE
jgi:DNA polymerase I-like protein with 3'-5' exonuclease and polymerase domains